MGSRPILYFILAGICCALALYWGLTHTDRNVRFNWSGGFTSSPDVSTLLSTAPKKYRSLPAPHQEKRQVSGLWMENKSKVVPTSFPASTIDISHQAKTSPRRVMLKSKGFPSGFLMRIFDLSGACGKVRECKTMPNEIPETMVFQKAVPEIKFSSASDFKGVFQALPNSFIATFDGEFSIKEIGTYKFCCESGSGSRVFVDGLVIAAGNSGGKACGTIRLIPGLHFLRAEAMSIKSAKAVVTYNGIDSGDSDKQIKSTAAASLAQRTPRGYHLRIHLLNEEQLGGKEIPELTLLFPLVITTTPTVEMDPGSFKDAAKPSLLPEQEGFGWLFFGRTAVALQGYYELCLAHGGTSRLLVDGAKIGEGPGRLCARKWLSMGAHDVLVAGFAARRTDAWVRLTYAGPDTAGRAAVVPSVDSSPPYPAVRGGLRAFAYLVFAGLDDFSGRKCDPEDNKPDPPLPTVPADTVAGINKYSGQQKVEVAPQFCQFQPCTTPYCIGIYPPPKPPAFPPEPKPRFCCFTPPMEERPLKPVAEGIVETLRLASYDDFVKEVSRTLPSTGFGWVVYGQVRVPKSGIYTFCVHSQDGARLFVDRKTKRRSKANLPVVENDGLKPKDKGEHCEKISLTPGLHEVRIDGFRNFKPAVLEASWSGPGQPKGPLQSVDSLLGSGLVHSRPATAFPSAAWAAKHGAPFASAGTIGDEDDADANGGLHAAWVADGAGRHGWREKADAGGPPMD